MALFIVAANFMHIERSLPVAVIGLIVAGAGLACDLWVRSSPAQLPPVISAPGHPLVVNVLFFGVMATLLGILIHSEFFVDPRWNWRSKTFSIATPVILLIGYSLLLTYVRRLRTRRQKSADI
jgi:hypothetical protein